MPRLDLYLHDSDEEDTCSLINFSWRGVKGNQFLFARRWTDAWRQLRALQETAWPFLSKQDLLAELCSSLLRCGAWRLAHSYLTSSGSTPLPPELAEQIVVSAGRDYFYSASTLDAPEVVQVALPPFRCSLLPLKGRCAPASATRTAAYPNSLMPG